jgi:hypothetical protein
LTRLCIRALAAVVLVACGQSHEMNCPTIDPWAPLAEQAALPKGCPVVLAGPCRDTDKSDDYPDGLDPYTAGKCTGVRGAVGIGSPDICTWHTDREGRLLESRCVDGECVRDEAGVRCDPGMICRGGRCVTGTVDAPFCVDADNGDPFTRGEVQAQDTYGGTDTCYRTRTDSPDAGVLIGDCDPELGPGEVCGVLEKTCGDGDSSVEVFTACEHGCTRGACRRE